MNLEDIRVFRILLEDGRTINIEVYPEVAPKTVENFIKLVDSNYYEGVVFHRVIDKFMIQTGGYYIDGNVLCEKESNETIVGEFASNGFENNIKHKLGVVSMARTNDPNSASGQFFICSASCPWLDGNYAAFAKVIDDESIRTVLDISHVQTTNIGGGFTDFPVEPITIKSIMRAIKVEL